MDLTREKVLAMEAGRQMDRLIAEKVMNLCVLDSVQQYGDGCVVSDEGFDSWINHPEYGRIEDPDLLEPYSTDISAAWDLVEKISKGEIDKSFYLALHYTHYWAKFGEVESSAETAPLAICRAALLTTLTE